jgi:hypothetical protein
MEPINAKNLFKFCGKYTKQSETNPKTVGCKCLVKVYSGFMKNVTKYSS